MLEQNLSQLRKLNIDNQVNHEEMKQYYLNFCLHIDDVHNANNKSSNGVLKLMKLLFIETTVDIAETAIARPHRIANKNAKASS